MCILPNETEAMISGQKCSVNYSDGVLSLSDYSIEYATGVYDYSGFSLDGRYFYAGTGTTLKIYEVDWEVETAWTPIQTITMPLGNFAFSKDMAFATGGSTTELRRLRKDCSAEIIGVKYKDEYFYKGGES